MNKKCFNKGLAVAIILLFIGVSAIPSTGTVVEKKSTMLTSFYDGNTLYVGGSGQGNYSRIQDAIDNASDGDTIRVYAGYYDPPCHEGGLRVYKNLNIIGNGSKCTTIKEAVYITSDRVIFKGFTVNGVECYQGSNGWWFCFLAVCIILENSNHCIISNNTLSDGHAGIWLNHSNNNIIDNNNISKNLNTAMELHFSNDNVIKRNIIREHHRLPFTSCVCIDSFSNNNLVYHNNFINNSYYHAYDKGINTWNNGYPSCGNYWDDYIGEDNDGDGVGDIPYNIPGGNNQDRYPLMRPYGQTKLEITKIKGGIFSFTIKNVGDETALNASWSIHFEGGIVFPREQHSFNNYNLAPDEEKTIVFWPSYIPEDRHLVFGIGRVIITVVANADNAPLVSESIPGFLFLFFIKIAIE